MNSGGNTPLVDFGVFLFLKDSSSVWLLLLDFISDLHAVVGFCRADALSKRTVRGREGKGGEGTVLSPNVDSESGLF